MIVQAIVESGVKSSYSTNKSKGVSGAIEVIRDLLEE